MSEQAGLTAQGLSDLYAVSRKNGTEIAFCELAVKWAALADAEIERLRTQLAAQQSAKPVAIVRSVAGSDNESVRIKWLGGFPQIGDRLYTHAQPVAAVDELAEFKKVMADVMADVIGPKYVGAIPRLLSQKENGEFVDDDINSYWFVWQARAKLRVK